MKYPKITARNVMSRIALVIAVSEFFIMLFLIGYLRPYPHIIEIILDVFFLILISSPVIYYWIILPFKQERDDAIRDLADMAYTDPLTGLPNRRVFLKCMEKTLAECARHHIHAALILIDLDEFKKVNDIYGHEAGDAVLVEIGLRLQSGVRTEDVVSRIGGDEFIILIKQLHDEVEKAERESLAFAENIKKKLSEPIQYKNRTIELDASLGINLLCTGTEKIEAEIRKSDIAMYHAKRKGKGNVLLYEPSMVGRNSSRT